LFPFNVLNWFWGRLSTGLPQLLRLRHQYFALQIFYSKQTGTRLLRTAAQMLALELQLTYRLVLALSFLLAHSFEGLVVAGFLNILNESAVEFFLEIILKLLDLVVLLQVL
jgi:hypothetical protein